MPSYCLSTHIFLSRQTALTYWDQDKIVTILWTVFSNTFPEWKLLYYDCNFDNWHEVSIGSDNGLTPKRRHTIIWINDGLVYRCIFSSLNLDEVTWQYIDGLMEDCSIPSAFVMELLQFCAIPSISRWTQWVVLHFCRRGQGSLIRTLLSLTWWISLRKYDFLFVIIVLIMIFLTLKNIGFSPGHYYDHWYPGGTKGQGINSDVINPVYPKHSWSHMEKINENWAKIVW